MPNLIYSIFKQQLLGEVKEMKNTEAMKAELQAAAMDVSKDITVRVAETPVGEIYSLKQVIDAITESRLQLAAKLTDSEAREALACQVIVEQDAGYRLLSERVKRMITPSVSAPWSVGGSEKALQPDRPPIETGCHEGGKCWMITNSGNYFDLANPNDEKCTVTIHDVAFALSNLTRFTGHVPFYSVAEHSLLCSLAASYAGYGYVQQLACLLHDAPEAYTGDISRPMKNLILGDESLDKLAQIEYRVLLQFGLFCDPMESEWNHQRVKEIDNLLLAIEKRHFYPDDHEYWRGLPEPTEENIKRLPICNMTPGEARVRFIERYEYLRDKINQEYPPTVDEGNCDCESKIKRCDVD